MRSSRLILWCSIVVALWFAACLEAPPPKTAPQDAAAPSDDDSTPATNEEADAGPGRDEPIMFPKSPMPQHLVVVDGCNLSDAMRTLLVSLQGVLAKTEPRLYFYPSPSSWFDSLHDQENRWLGEMQTKWDVTSETMTDPWAVLDRFIDDVDGFIVFDPDLPQSINVATTLAGLNHAVIADPSLIADLEGRGLTALEDLRGRFADNVELYTWAFANVWPESNQGILAFLQEDLMPLRDYLVANNIFTFQLDPHHWAERPLLETVLNGTPANIPILGWPLDELLGVIIFSIYGKYLVCTDFVANLSAHSGLPRPELTQTHITEFPEVENKIYVSFAYTDGDSMSYLNRWLPMWFDDPAYDQLPIGWEVALAPLDLAPDVISYYYDHLTENNMIIGPVSGLGYMYPNRYPDLGTFLEQTKPYLDAAAMRTLWVINDDLTFPDDIANQYGLDLDLLGIYIDYWPTSDKGWYLTSEGIPVLRSRVTYLASYEQIPNILSDAAIEKEYLYPDEPTFVFLGVNGWTTTPTYLKSIVDGLDDRYVVLRPDAMFAAMKTAL